MLKRTKVAAVILMLLAAITLWAKVFKFEFTGVMFPDRTTGTIRAGSKQTGNGSTFTVCDYYTDADAFLGQYGDSTFFSSDPATVEQFCLDHFADRQ